MAQFDSREKILRLFRARNSDYLSGEELSQELGISRTAVWKHIRALRALGYQIDAVTSKGYRLLSGPVALVADEIRSRLSTRVIGREILCHEQLASTNLTAMELGEAGAAEGLVVIAEQQTAGKGRLGRRWESPAGVNLYLSILLRPAMPPWEVPRLTFLSAVAAARALQDVTGLKVEVKWPNDLLVNGKKIAGLLNEMSAESDAVHHVVLGLGLNINMTADQFPSELRYPATSVWLEKGTLTSRLDVVVALLEHFDRLYDEFLRCGMEPVRQAWQELFAMLGKAVRVESGPASLKGVVAGIDEEGALLLQLPDGTIEKVLAGDVLPVE
ncbi:MAG TPA: biotin--[acetyl-CoA-carboxylase] ligase [Geothermobacteraceae bacterium]|nr:biotin--[acetyl-CoA-carboxylase] ligase [Geothermobacteraceae bacterium]